MYIEEALKGKNEFWRYLVSIGVFIVAYIVGQIPLTIVILNKAGFGEATAEFTKTLDFESIGINPLLGFSLIILTFVFLFFAIIIAVTSIHNRPLKTLLTSHNKFDWKKVFFAAGIMFLLLSINEFIYYSINPDNYVINAKVNEVLPLALVALILLPFQISSEEFLLRGYLTQGLGLFFRYGWMAVVTASVIFGLLHYQNPEVKEYGVVLSMSYYIGFGLFMGVIVLMSEGLELSLGVHFIINFYSIVLVTYPSSAIKTPALFSLVNYRPADLILGFIFTALAFLIIVSVKYKWYDWGKLIQRVRRPESEAGIQ